MAQHDGGVPGAVGPRSPERRRILGLAAAALVTAGHRTPSTSVVDSREDRGQAFDVGEENRRPGASDWRIVQPGPPHAIEGFAEQASVPAGRPAALRVSTTAATFTVSAYRMGWYGGALARLVWRSGRLRGNAQTPPSIAEGTRTVRCDWRRTLEVDTSGWPEGCYLLRLDAGEGQGQRYVPLTIRSSSAAGRVMVVNSVATWQAYNTWGGIDLYKGADGKKKSRALAVSFDRPYANAYGAGQYFVYEAPLVALAERMGLPLAYATGVDIAREARLLDGAVAMLSLGHDEYWSPEQRQHVAAARDGGMNLAVLGANCCYRRIRFEPTTVGTDRLVVCYKDDYAEDPGFRQGLPPTNDYRRKPASEPESSLLGVLYDGYPVDAPLVVSHPDHWLLEGSGTRPGDSFPHLVGVEFDRVNPARPTPRPLEILAHSPVVCKGRPSHADMAYCSLNGGAGLFATGTMRWVEALKATGQGSKGANHGLDGRAGDFTRTVTSNLLRAFARGPAGRTNPALDNVGDHYGPDGAPIAP
ncbi:N,N-dimethylformamidase beta subunit family domain-containing protein [Streptomyces sp. SCSIO 30461]|uniref:N,N-dimethylformamidase beta subunit family domain-containing protein n=1 Tax=Streptomyces sp. SCSIO 30461 TaxID=3118085 RepID=UPI0030CAAE14